MPLLRLTSLVLDLVSFLHFLLVRWHRLVQERERGRPAHRRAIQRRVDKATLERVSIATERWTAFPMSVLHPMACPFAVW